MTPRQRLNAHADALAARLAGTGRDDLAGAARDPPGPAAAPVPDDRRPPSRHRLPDPSNPT